MTMHLSLRLPWHDRGWDGHVCDNPTANVYCAGEYGLKAHGIRDRKKDDLEEGIKGKPYPVKDSVYQPPCGLTIQTFGGPKAFEFAHEPKSFLSSKQFPLMPVIESVGPYTAGSWPFDRVYRQEEADDQTPEMFVDRYSPEEATKLIESFFQSFKPKHSLCFFYLNYDNPLNSERRRYVLVGAAEIDEISRQHEWEHMDPKIADVYGSLIWNRLVTHGYGDGRGARLPYERYLQQALDPSPILLEIPDELSQHFKYVCREFTDDEAAILLDYLLEALERGKTAAQVDWEWDRQITWVDHALQRVLRNRGFFPGMAPVLDALGFPRATMYVQRYITDNGIKDIRRHVLDRIEKSDLAETPEHKMGFESVKRTLKLLPETIRKLLFDRLCLFELTTEQVKIIAGGDLVADDIRQASGIISQADAIINNPYLIIEEYDPVDRDDRIPFHRIDHGIYLPKTRGETVVPGIEAFAPDDARRLRAAAIQRLRSAARDGDSFLAQPELIAWLSRLKLPGLTSSLGAITLGRDLEFHQERLSVRAEGALIAWMLKTADEDEELIRTRIKTLRNRKPINLSVKDWKKYLPEPDVRLSKEIAAAAANEQATILERLARQPLSVLIGGAGTGKTTAIAALIKGLNTENPGENYVLLTPTGKAAVRLRRRIKEVARIDLQPRTLHSYLLGTWLDEDTFKPIRDGIPIEDGGTTIVIDESSMLDVPMLATVFRALDWKTVRRLILVGDPQQLPPIGMGAPLRNLVDALNASQNTAAMVCDLTVNCRQIQEGSAALRLAEQFSSLAKPEEADELLDKIRLGGRVGLDLEVRFFENEHDLPDKLTKIVADAVFELSHLEGTFSKSKPGPLYEAYDELHGFKGTLEAMRLDALEVLSPYRGAYFGSDALNRHLQQLIRGKLFSFPYTKKVGRPGGRRYVWPDKVLQIQNVKIKTKSKLAYDGKTHVDAYVANGELGRIMKIDRFDKENVAWIRFETNPKITFTVHKDWAEQKLDLGYAMTIHKAQGSDFVGVIAIIPKEERQLLVSRELLYTALTRFTRRLYLLVQGKPGDITALLRGLWLGSSDYLRRNTSLYALTQAIPDVDDFRPEERIHRTLRDELVRSKSEALISNQLVTRKVPFYYEKPLIAPDGTVRRPDFTIPIETPDGPDVLYWEHWGLLGDPGYDATVKRRREWYQKHGFAPNLIETDEINGFDSKKIDQIIKERLLP